MASGTGGGRTAPTGRDVAALAGVAQSTVSAVMSGNRPVAAGTRRRVEDAMRALRYQPNAGARTLRTARTNVIALIVYVGPGIDAAETVPYIDTIVEEARRLDHDVVLSTVREGAAGVTRLAGRSICDAFIMMDVQTRDDRVPAAAELGLPVVLIGRPDDPHGLDVVDFDTRRSAELLVDELAATGHRHLAVLGEPSGEPVPYRFVQDFYAGARDRAASHGIELTVVPRPSDTWDGVAAAAGPLQLARRRDRAPLLQCDATALPFAAGTFGTVTALWISTDVDDFAGAPREAARATCRCPA
ncbi:LacI family DNA-binding transcriptional regulator [Nonomuraea rubra]